MKKKSHVTVFLVAVLMLFLLPAVGALSEETETTDDSTGAPFTWAYIGTIAGATAVTLLVVQFLKVPLDRIWKIPTRVFVYIIAAVLMIAAKAFTSGIASLNDVLLVLTNAFIVATSAYGSYEITFKKLE